jgi:hypothetical protein
MDILTQQLGGSVLRQISGKLGVDERIAGPAIGAALPLLLGALSKNASREDGARDLHRAVRRDHDGSVLDNLGGFLNRAEEGPGEGILRHVLGQRRGRVESGISRATGMDTGSAGNLMAMLAPVVMGAIGKTQREQGMDERQLAGYLREERREIERRRPESRNVMERLLDRDDDDDDDVDIGDVLGGLGKLFG